MPRNPTNSFRKDEIAAFLELIAIVERGGDPTVVMRHPAMGRLRVKFLKMKDLIVRQGAEA
jgi:hypothetical protein